MKNTFRKFISLLLLLRLVIPVGIITTSAELASLAFAQGKYQQARSLFQNGDIKGTAKILEVVINQKQVSGKEWEETLKLYGICKYIMGDKVSAKRAFQLALNANANAQLSRKDSLDPDIIPFFNSLKKPTELVKKTPPTKKIVSKKVVKPVAAKAPKAVSAVPKAKVAIGTRRSLKPPPRRAPVALSAAAFTGIHVTTNDPAALVFSDGLFVGKPEQDISLGEGRQKISVTAPGKKEVTKVFTLKKNERLKINVQLESDKPIRAAPVKKTAATEKAPLAQEKVPSTKINVPARGGSSQQAKFTGIYVTTNVARATIFEGGIFIGSQDQEIALNPGRHSITLTAEGKKDLVTTFNLRSGERLKLNLKLESPPAPKPVVVAQPQQQQRQQQQNSPTGGRLLDEFNRDGVAQPPAYYPPPGYAQQPAYYPPPPPPPAYYPYPYNYPPPAPPPAPYGHERTPEEDLVYTEPYHDDSRRMRSSPSGGSNAFLALLPFGVGQFQNGSVLKGTFFLVAEAVALGTGFYFIMQRSEYRNGADYAYAINPPASGKTANGTPYDKSFADGVIQYDQGLTTWMIVSFVGFGVIYAGGVIDSFVFMKKGRSSRASLDVEHKIAEQPNFQVSPMAQTDGRMGLNLKYQF